MSREFPDRIDPWKAADGRREFRGTVPVTAAEPGPNLRMPRLLPLIGESSQDARFKLRFFRDRQGRAVVDVAVNVTLELVCQRSLRPYMEPIERRSRLVIVESDNDNHELTESEEAVLVDEGSLDIIPMIEDEILLALPQVPRDPSVESVSFTTDPEWTGETVPAADQPDEPMRKPFAGLADLLKD